MNKENKLNFVPNTLLGTKRYAECTNNEFILLKSFSSFPLLKPIKSY